MSYKPTDFTATTANATSFGAPVTFSESNKEEKPPIQKTTFGQTPFQPSMFTSFGVGGGASEKPKESVEKRNIYVQKERKNTTYDNVKKKIILLIGPTHNGKSCFANLLFYGKPLSEAKNEIGGGDLDLPYPVGDANLSLNIFKELQVIPYERAVLKKTEEGKKQELTGKSKDDYEVDKFHVGIVVTPGLDEDTDRDPVILSLFHSLERLRKNGDELSCVVLVTKYPANSKQFMESVDFYKDLLPDVFEQNVILLFTSVSTDAKWIEEEGGKVVMEAKFEKVRDDLTKHLGLEYTIPYLTIDSLTERTNLGGWAHCENIRKTILSSACTRSGVKLSNFILPKTKDLLKFDNISIATLKKENEKYKKKLDYSHSKKQKQKKQIIETLRKLRKKRRMLKREYMKKNVDSAMVVKGVGVSDLRGDWGLFDWTPSAKFNIRTKFDILKLEVCGGWISKLSKDKRRQKRGNVTDYVFEKMNASISVWARKRDVYKKRLESIFEELVDRNRMIEKLEFIYRQVVDTDQKKKKGDDDVSDEELLEKIERKYNRNQEYIEYFEERKCSVERFREYVDMHLACEEGVSGDFVMPIPEKVKEEIEEELLEEEEEASEEEQKRKQKSEKKKEMSFQNIILPYASGADDFDDRYDNIRELRVKETGKITFSPAKWWTKSVIKIVNKQERFQNYFESIDTDSKEEEFFTHLVEGGGHIFKLEEELGHSCPERIVLDQLNKNLNFNASEYPKCKAMIFVSDEHLNPIRFVENPPFCKLKELFGERIFRLNDCFDRLNKGSFGEQLKKDEVVIVHCGDQTDWGLKSSFLLFKFYCMVSGFKNHCLVPGNHDVLSTYGNGVHLKSSYENFIYLFGRSSEIERKESLKKLLGKDEKKKKEKKKKIIEYPLLVKLPHHHYLMLLDSTGFEEYTKGTNLIGNVTSWAGGVIGNPQLGRMEKLLKEVVEKDENAKISMVLHHHPIAGLVTNDQSYFDIGWELKFGGNQHRQFCTRLIDSDKFLKYLEKFHKNILGVIFGHQHIDFQGMKDVSSEKGKKKTVDFYSLKSLYYNSKKYALLVPLEQSEDSTVYPFKSYSYYS